MADPRPDLPPMPVNGGRYLVTAGLWSVVGLEAFPRYAVCDTLVNREVFACVYASQVSAFIVRDGGSHLTDAEMAGLLALSTRDATTGEGER